MHFFNQINPDEVEDIKKYSVPTTWPRWPIFQLQHTISNTADPFIQSDISDEQLNTSQIPSCQALPCAKPSSCGIGLIDQLASSNGPRVQPDVEQPPHPPQDLHVGPQLL